MAVTMFAFILLVAILALFDIVAKRIALAGSVEPLAVCALAVPAPDPLMIRNATPVAVCADNAAPPLPAITRNPTPVAVCALADPDPDPIEIDAAVPLAI